ncbi:hypothetical protein ES332_D13G139000v1 [Gossypium tomentosum]|nr:hypothetical protein ES332_D13G139000v1 [Gossypium tomentosum]
MYAEYRPLMMFDNMPKKGTRGHKLIAAKSVANLIREKLYNLMRVQKLAARNAMDCKLNFCSGVSYLKKMLINKVIMSYSEHNCNYGWD